MSKKIPGEGSPAEEPSKPEAAEQSAEEQAHVPDKAELREQARQSIMDAYLRRDTTAAKNFAKEAKIPVAERKEIALGSFHELLRRGKILDAGRLLEEEKLGKDEVFATPEAKEAGLRGVEHAVSSLMPDAAVAIVKKCELTEEQLVTPESQKLAKDSALRILKGGSRSGFLMLSQLYRLPEDFYRSQEVLNAARVGVHFMLGKKAQGKGDLDHIAAAIEAHFGVSRDDEFSE